MATSRAPPVSFRSQRSSRIRSIGSNCATVGNIPVWRSGPGGDKLHRAHRRSRARGIGCQPPTDGEPIETRRTKDWLILRRKHFPRRHTRHRGPCATRLTRPKVSEPRPKFNAIARLLCACGQRSQQDNRNERDKVLPTGPAAFLSFFGVVAQFTVRFSTPSWRVPWALPATAQLVGRELYVAKLECGIRRVSDGCGCAREGGRNGGGGKTKAEV
jgi:hypothetical protein